MDFILKREKILARRRVLEQGEGVKNDRERFLVLEEQWCGTRSSAYLKLDTMVMKEKKSVYLYLELYDLKTKAPLESQWSHLFSCSKDLSFSM